jgi:methylglutaconyl-CoA hydratase
MFRQLIRSSLAHRASVSEPASRTLSSAAASSPYVVTEQRSRGVTEIRMTRADLHNAFNDEMIGDLTAAFAAIDPETTRCVVLSGDGKSFCAGADMNWMKRMVKYSEAENAADSCHLFDMFATIAECPVPVIARVHGAAVGGGVGLAAAADIAFATEKAVFGLTEVRLGLVPAVISPHVARKMGATHCARYFLTGARFDAAEARRTGLVQEVVADAAQLDELVNDTAKAIASSGPVAVREAKKLSRSGVERMPIAESREYVTSLIARLRVGEEGQDGLTSFLEKRKPAWLDTSDKK